MAKKYVDYGQKATDQELEKLEARLKKEYAQASKEVTEKMNKHLSKFASKDEAKRALVADGKLSKDDYITWRQNQLYIAGRWEELANTLTEDYTNVNKITASMISDHNYDVFALNHNYGAFEIDSAVKTGTSWTLYDRHTVEMLAKGNKDLPLKANMDKVKDVRWNKQQINSAMMQGILQGESIPNIAKRLPLAVGEKNLNGAIRRARTLTTYAQNSGRLDAYKEAAEESGLKIQKCWIATLDNRTRDSHAELNGECVDLDDEFPNGLQCPGDESGDASEIYNCRCTMISQIEGLEHDLGFIEEWKLEHQKEEFEEWQDEQTKGDVRLTDSIEDYALPKEVEEKIDEIMEMKTYDDFENYFNSFGITLETDIESLKGDKRNDEIPAVRDFCQKVAIANEIYRSEFGDESLSALKTIVLYDNEETSFAAYYFNLVGEDDPKAGSIRFSDWNANGREIIHEFGHAMQDSLKEENSDACLFAKDVAEHISMDEIPNPKTTWNDYSYEAEKMADAIGRAYWSGEKEDVEFVNELKKYLKKRHRR